MNSMSLGMLPSIYIYPWDRSGKELMCVQYPSTQWSVVTHGGITKAGALWGGNTMEDQTSGESSREPCGSIRDSTC